MYRYYWSRIFKCKDQFRYFWNFPNIETLQFPDWYTLYAKNESNFIFAVLVNNVNVGFFSIHDFCGMHRCNLGTWIDHKYRGPNTVLLGKKTLRFLHGEKGIKNIYSVTPWMAAKILVARMGMQSVAEIPNFAIIKNRVRDVDVYHSETNLCRYHMQAELVNEGLPDSDIAQRLKDTFGE